MVEGAALRPWPQWGRAAAAAAVSLGAIGLALGAEARTGEGLAASTGRPAIGSVPLAALPMEAQQTQRLIFAGGPFSYEKDGIVFGNREQRLPRHPRGYYREYTVRTPGAADRGAQRIVCGGSKPREPEACFYTEDHYASFRRIAW